MTAVAMEAPRRLWSTQLEGEACHLEALVFAPGSRSGMDYRLRRWACCIVHSAGSWCSSAHNAFVEELVAQVDPSRRLWKRRRIRRPPQSWEALLVAALGDNWFSPRSVDPAELAVGSGTPEQQDMLSLARFLFLRPSSVPLAAFPIHLSVNSSAFSRVSPARLHTTSGVYPKGSTYLLCWSRTAMASGEMK